MQLLREVPNWFEEKRCLLHNRLRGDEFLRCERGEILPRPPFSRDGAIPADVSSDSRPKRLARAPSTRSETGQPAAANIARRECLISALRNLIRSSLVFAKLRGSKPLSP